MDRYVVTEELLAAGAPVAAHWVGNRQIGPSLLRYGSEVQRQRFLPGIVRGKMYFSIGMSEPDSGSDLASVRTRAERVDGGMAAQRRQDLDQRRPSRARVLRACAQRGGRG